MMSKPELLNFVSAQLQDMGYRGQILDDIAVGSAASGLRFIAFMYDDSIQLQCIFGKSDEGKLEEKLALSNEFNRVVRFSSLHVDEDSNLVLEAHWLLDPADPNAKMTFEKILTIWEFALIEAKARISSTLKSAGPDTDEDGAS